MKLSSHALSSSSWFTLNSFWTQFVCSPRTFPICFRVRLKMCLQLKRIYESIHVSLGRRRHISHSHAINRNARTWRRRWRRWRARFMFHHTCRHRARARGGSRSEQPNSTLLLELFFSSSKIKDAHRSQYLSANEQKRGKQVTQIVWGKQHLRCCFLIWIRTRKKTRKTLELNTAICAHWISYQF